MCPRLHPPPPPDTRRSGRYGPPRALGGSGGALGKEGEVGLSGLPEGVAPWLGSPADGRLQLLLDVRRDTQHGLGGLGLEVIRAEDAMRGLGLSQR